LQTWQPQAILVYDWLISKISSVESFGFDWACTGKYMHRNRNRNIFKHFLYLNWYCLFMNYGL
jgi:hypothetical protein